MGNKVLDKLEPAIREAGRVLVKHWPSKPLQTNELSVNKKVDGSLVTTADLASETILISAINQYFPDDTVFSEERTAAGDKVTQNKTGYTWIIDPLDGTRHFVEGRSDFSILVARALGGSVNTSVMHFPARSLYAQAIVGEGASANGVPLKVSTNDKILDAGRVYLRHVKLNDPTKIPSWIYAEPMDSGMAFLSVANGDFDGLIIRMNYHQEWDVAAPLLMIQEAGGRVSDGEGKEIKFNCAPVTYQYVVASNGKVHEELLRKIKEFPAQG